jgi:hypothetical protein
VAQAEVAQAEAAQAEAALAEAALAEAALAGVALVEVALVDAMREVGARGCLTRHSRVGQSVPSGWSRCRMRWFNG